MTGSVSPDARRDKQRHRNDNARRLIAAILFTAMEVWAIGDVLTEIHPSASASLALAFALAAAIIAVVESWLGIRDSRRSDQ